MNSIMDSHAPSYRLIETIAQKKGVSPTELSPPLFNVIDPDALDALVQADADSNTGGIEIEFTYLNYIVQIRNDSTVNISVLDRDASIENPESASESGASLEE